MTRYLLNHLSTTWLIVLVVGGSVVLAVVASILFRRKFPNIADSDFENITGILRADVFALLYSIILALVIADQSSSLATASSTVSQETSALAQITASYEAFPAAEAEPISTEIDEYVHAVVEDEFPAMREGKASQRAAAALEALYAAYRNYEPATEAQKAFYGRSIDSVAEITTQRRERLQQSEDGLSPLLRTLLVVGALIFVLLAYPASIRNLRVQLLIVAATAALVSFAYLLTMVFDYPYAGAVSVDSSPYKLGVLAQFWGEDVQPRPLDTPGLGKLTAADMVGKWNSDQAYGAMSFKEVDGEIRGAFRLAEGTVTGRLGEDGVYRGWWCDEPGRVPPDHAGDVEWRLLTEPGSEPKLDGRWRYGSDGPMRGGWDLIRVSGAEPADLAAVFEDTAAFCAHP